MQDGEYKVQIWPKGGASFYVVVIASSSSFALTVVKQQFPGHMTYSVLNRIRDV